MSVWYDGENLNMYKGDYGIITFQGLPVDKEYKAYFSIKSTKTNEILLETSADVEPYFVDENGIEIFDDDYYSSESSESGEIYEYGKAKIVLLPSMTDKLPILKNEEYAKYYFGLKICCVEDGDEDTLIPAVIVDEETGIPHFEDAPYFILRQKYVEGLLPFKQYCDDIDEVEKDPADYGLQKLLEEGDGITITGGNIISCTKKFKLEDLTNVKITNLKDGDVLTFDSSSGNWINKHST